MGLMAAEVRVTELAQKGKRKDNNNGDGEGEGEMTQYILDKTVWSRYTFKLVDWEPNKTSYNTKTERHNIQIH